MDLRECTLASGDAPTGCDWCGVLLVGRQRRWCSAFCEYRFRANHVWRFARPEAIRRAERRCAECGATNELEVNHVVPLAGRSRAESCAHHQDNLEVLCHGCHVEATARQREVGWFAR